MDYLVERLSQINSVPVTECIAWLNARIAVSYVSSDYQASAIISQPFACHRRKPADSDLSKCRKEIYLILNHFVRT